MFGYNQIYCFFGGLYTVGKNSTKPESGLSVTTTLTTSTDLDVLAGSASRNWQNHKPLKCNHSLVVTSFSAGSCGSAQKPKKSVAAAQ